MATIDEIKQQAEAVKNATQVGENTAMRVGGALAGLADIAKEQEDNIRKKADKAYTDVELGKKFDKESVVQSTGESEDKVMSQKAVSAKLSDLTKPLSVYRGKYLRYNGSNLINYDKIYMSELLLILNKDVEINGNTTDKNLYGISFFDK